MTTKIFLDSDNRMLRIGAGKHEGRWFIRIDLWTKGFRWTFGPDKHPDPDELFYIVSEVMHGGSKVTLFSKGEREFRVLVQRVDYGIRQNDFVVVEDTLFSDWVAAKTHYHGLIETVIGACSSSDLFRFMQRTRIR